MRKKVVIVSMSWADTYELLVYEIENIFIDRGNGPTYVLNAMKIIVDLVSSDEHAEEAAVKLLYDIRQFYRAIMSQVYIDEELRLLIYKINKFTERYSGDLTTFVNSISWTGGCVPYYWAQTTEESVFDTSEWIVFS